MESKTQLNDWTILNQQIAARAQNDAQYHRLLLENPRAAMEQAFGQPLPEQVQVKVIEQEPDTIYLLLPSQAAADAQELSAEALDTVVGGLSNGIIFTTPIIERGNTNSLLATSYEP